MAGSGGSQAEMPLQDHSPGSGSLDRRSREDRQELAIAHVVIIMPSISKAMENTIALNKRVGPSKHLNSLSWGCPALCSPASPAGVWIHLSMHSPPEYGLVDAG